MKAKTTKNIKRLLLGRSISFLGSGIYLICLPLYILEITNSLSTTGLYFAIVALPALVFMIPLGAWCEKINHKLLLIGCDFVSGFIFLILTILAIFNNLNIIMLMGFGMLLSLVDTVFGIVSNVLFTELNDSSSLEAMNGLKSIFDNIINLSAPMIGTFLYGMVGMKVVLCINAMSFILSAIQEMFIEYTPPIHSHEKDQMLPFIKEGLTYVIQTKALLPLFILVMVLNFFVSPSEEVYFPGILKQLHGIPDTWYGLSGVAFVCGTLLASFMIYRSHKINWKKLLYPLFIMASTIMVLMGVYSYYTMYINRELFYCGFLVLTVMNGITTSLVNIPLISSFQSDVDIMYQARFFALLNFASRLLIPLGMMYAGYLCEWIRPDLAYIMQNIFVILIVCMVIYSRKRLV